MVLRKIVLEWVTITPKPYEMGSPAHVIYEIKPDGSREQVELEIHYAQD